MMDEAEKSLQRHRLASVDQINCAEKSGVFNALVGPEIWVRIGGKGQNRIANVPSIYIPSKKVVRLEDR